MTYKFGAAALVLLAACAGPGSAPAPSGGGVATGSSATEVAKSTLNSLQEQSFRENREYCGYIVSDSDGALSATPATQGDATSCLAAEPSGGTIVASYHTHGGFDPDALSEVPSSSDLQADRDEGINGYVATPGGRFWFVDGAAQQAREVCGIGCLAKDPAFQAGLLGPLQQSYTLQQLKDFETAS